MLETVCFIELWTENFANFKSSDHINLVGDFSFGSYFEPEIVRVIEAFLHVDVGNIGTHLIFTFYFFENRCFFFFSNIVPRLNQLSAIHNPQTLALVSISPVPDLFIVVLNRFHRSFIVRGYVERRQVLLKRNVITFGKCITLQECLPHILVVLRNEDPSIKLHQDETSHEAREASGKDTTEDGTEASLTLVVDGHSSSKLVLIFQKSCTGHLANAI